MGAIAVAVSPSAPVAAPPPPAVVAATAPRGLPAAESGVAGQGFPVARPRAGYRWPLAPAPRVLRRFAVGPAPWSPGHRGVDLAATAGQRVLAAGPGVVTFAGRIAGVGAVSLAHAGGIRTTYQPVTAAVRVGEHVAAGQVLGKVSDWPGHCPGPCLHWGALHGSTYLDPLVLLGLVPPVLLPLSG
jgi:murein DD-endopeptidase MepM/ murein hydrolase activator NlpD